MHLKFVITNGLSVNALQAGDVVHDTYVLTLSIFSCPPSVVIMEHLACVPPPLIFFKRHFCATLAHPHHRFATRLQQ